MIEKKFLVKIIRDKKIFELIVNKKDFVLIVLGCYI